MATTTNYGWTTPDDTSLVKDGAAAIRTLGSSVDTTTKALNPSTTLGDIEYRSATANTNTRLAIGSSGQVLSVSAGVPAWVTSAAGGMALITSGSFSGASVTLSSIPSTYKNLEIVIRNYKPASNDTQLGVRFNGDSGANRYEYGSVNSSQNDTYERTEIQVQVGQNSTTSDAIYQVKIIDYANTTTWKLFDVLALGNSDTTSSNLDLIRNWGAYNQTGAITSITLFPASGNFTSGDYFLYGVQ
jgi:hypothetical protein